nr:hypothetical protein CFP56_36303 [Quercus suber]
MRTLAVDHATDTICTISGVDEALLRRDGGAKIRVDNVHYDLTEDDLRKGPTVSVRLMYDRMDRSEGTAYVVYEDPRDARRAIADFDGQNANGQPIRLSLLPTGPSAAPRGSGASMFDRIQRPERSMFERIERDRGHGYDSGDELGGSYRRRAPAYGRRERSDSPRKSRPLADGLDRYVPGGARGSRSPIRRRGVPRDVGRRPGVRREDNGREGRGGGGARGGRRGGRTDDEGRPIVGGRPKKTADELDAEMEDYWGSKAANGNGEGAQNSGGNETAGDSTAVVPIDDIDMDV